MSLNDIHKFCFIHVALIIDNNELKTKPIQQSMSKLRSFGIIPNFLVLRSKIYPNNDLMKKLSLQCHINQHNIIINPDVPNIYYVPNVFFQQNLMTKILQYFNYNTQNLNYNLANYFNIINHFNTNKTTINITIAGKYVGFPDTYLSLIRALEHAAFFLNIHIKIQWLNTDDHTITIKDTNCVIIPGGFGSRGIKGKIEVARICRKNKIPLLGICLGMQVMIVALFKDNNIDADSSEWNKETPNPVIDILPNQNGILGGTMRLGNYTTVLYANTKTQMYYNNFNIIERHRHRYEFNNKYLEMMNKFGMTVSGMNLDNNLVEIVELKDHPFYIGCQFHPEYSSKNNLPHPLFIGLLKSSLSL
jgi:CTP synthase